MRDKKKVFGYILLFLIVFIITFFYSCFFTPVNGDTLFCYGFSYNISHGLVIYRDFNVLLMPLYFFVGSIFIRLFGNYVYSIYIMNALFMSGMFIVIFKIIGWKSSIVYPIVLFFYVATYNSLCLFILFLVIYFINNKKDNYILIGFLIGLIFITKQNLIVLIIPALIYSKNKLKTIEAFFIPVLSLLLYLVYNDALFEFINYCFLGLFDFGSSNKYISVFAFIELVIILYFIILLFKSKFRDRELFYIFMFQVIVYPIFDLNHFCFVFVPSMYYMVKRVKNIYIDIVILFTIYFLFFSVNEIRPYYVSDNNYLYFINDNYGKLSKMLEEEEKIIMRYDLDYDYQFFIVGHVYARKLYMSKMINNYDMLYNGNIGYKGDKRIINDMSNFCNSNSCVFFVEEMDFSNNRLQFNEEIYNYVINNYDKVDSNYYLDIYSNK